MQSGIVLQIASNPTIDVTLKVGAANEQVVVEAAAAMVETQNAGVGQVIDQQRVVDLPLNGRQVTDLILFTGGANTSTLSGRASYPSSTGVSIGGGGVGTVSYVMDGGTHNDPLSNQNLPLPFPDAIQEFKVETSSLPAQYGYHSAGAVNVVTKSGGNQLHGDAFEFVRNYLFNARNSFQPLRDTLKRNQFGGTVGGPIKEQTVLLHRLSGQHREVHAQRRPTAFVPTPAMLQGDFQTVTSTQCRGGATQSAGFARVSPITLSRPSLFSPIALNLVKLLPTTADPCGKITYATPASFTRTSGAGPDGLPTEQQAFDLRPLFRNELLEPRGKPQRGHSGRGHRRRFRQRLQRHARGYVCDHAQHGEQLPGCGQPDFKHDGL